MEIPELPSNSTDITDVPDTETTVVTEIEPEETTGGATEAEPCNETLIPGVLEWWED
jgi:hypothetical protein